VRSICLAVEVQGSANAVSLGHARIELRLHEHSRCGGVRRLALRHTPFTLTAEAGVVNAGNVGMEGLLSTLISNVPHDCGLLRR
jgi:hypothetical protein